MIFALQKHQSIVDTKITKHLYKSVKWDIVRTKRREMEAIRDIVASKKTFAEQWVAKIKGILLHKRYLELVKSLVW